MRPVIIMTQPDKHDEGLSRLGVQLDDFDAKRARKVTMALKAYAALTTSAARGAVRIVPE